MSGFHASRNSRFCRYVPLEVCTSHVQRDTTLRTNLCKYVGTYLCAGSDVSSDSDLSLTKTAEKS